MGLFVKLAARAPVARLQSPVRHYDAAAPTDRANLARTSSSIDSPVTIENRLLCEISDSVPSLQS
jgi:hypothetical protein